MFLTNKESTNMKSFAGGDVSTEQTAMGPISRLKDSRPPHRWMTFIHPQTGYESPIKVQWLDEERDEMYTKRGFILVKENLDDAGPMELWLWDEMKEGSRKKVRVSAELAEKVNAIRAKNRADLALAVNRTPKGKAEQDKREIAEQAANAVADRIAERSETRKAKQ